ncbi:Sec8 exocyst complex component-specific domain-containing protein [Globomyces pollinis-pini]|nr:Sec8 exocyst complex component-specific domain-containing protein [Globomyces pollinis-pini]
MFAGRQRQNIKKESKSPIAAAFPQIEGNSNSNRASTIVETDDASSFPSSVTDIMSVVRLNWDFMTTTEFNPIPYALSLLDGSSLGSDFEGFCKVYQGVEVAMDQIVNDYHQAFNNVIQKFSSVVDIISDSQIRVGGISTDLEHTKEWLECKRFDLIHLWVKAVQHKEMSRILDIMYSLKLMNRTELESVEVNLVHLIQDQNYLQAVRILNHAEKQISGPDLEEIGALDNIRDRLKEIKTLLHDTLTGELQSHIYLGNRSAMARIGKDNSNPIDPLRFHKIDFSIDGEDPVNVFDIDSYALMIEVVEGLFHLGSLSDSLMFLKDRIRVDISRLVGGIIDEIEQIQTQSIEKGLNSSEIAAEVYADHVIFNMLLHSLFQKLQAVLDGHLFLLECVGGFQEKSGQQFETYTRREVGMCIQHEIKSLLYDYMTGRDHSSKLFSPAIVVSEMINDTKLYKDRPKVPIYLNLKPDESIKKIYFELQPNSINDYTKISLNDKFSKVNETSHKILINPTPSNIIIAYKPAMEFVSNMELSVASKLGNFKAFLDEFIFNTYFPRIQDQILAYYQVHINGVDAFQADRIPEAPYPLVKSAMSVILATHGILRTIWCMPVHQNELIKFLESLLLKYYDKCFQRFRCNDFFLMLDLFSGDDTVSETESNSSTVLSVQWAMDPEISDVISDITHFSAKKINYDVNRIMYEKETLVELKKKGERSFHRSELLLDPKKMQSLAHLLYSLEWVLDQLKFIRGQKPSNESSNSIFSVNSKDIMRAFSNLSEISVIDVEMGTETDLDLPLTPEMEKRFDQMMSDYQQLIDHILFSLRIEIRCHAIFFLDLAIRDGNHNPDELIMEPDPYIGLLNSDLTAVEELISEAISPRKTGFLFEGITQLMTHVLLMNLKLIREINMNGVVRLVSNVQALEQNFISFNTLYTNDLDRAKKYFQLLGMDGPEVINFLEDNVGLFTFEEYKGILRLVYCDSNGRDKNAKVEVEKQLDDYFIKHRK